MTKLDFAINSTTFSNQMPDPLDDKDFKTGPREEKLEDAICLNTHRQKVKSLLTEWNGKSCKPVAYQRLYKDGFKSQKSLVFFQIEKVMPFVQVSVISGVF